MRTICECRRRLDLLVQDVGPSLCLCLCFRVTPGAVWISTPSRTADDVPHLVSALLQTRIYPLCIHLTMSLRLFTLTILFCHLALFVSRIHDAIPLRNSGIKLRHARDRFILYMTEPKLTTPPPLGSNLSSGQRQLVSLARAMLTPSNILVLDEATAAVDVETDAMLQQTLRSPLFAHRTIITVAHRINTILDSDRVVVLDKGEVAEFGTPEELIARKGIFHSLVKQAGLDKDEQGQGTGNGR